MEPAKPWAFIAMTRERAERMTDWVRASDAAPAPAAPAEPESPAEPAVPGAAADVHGTDAPTEAHR